MHSGKLNSTQLNCSVQFPAVYWISDDSVTKLAVVAGSSQAGHNLVNRPINAMSVVGRKPATTAVASSWLSRTCDGRRSSLRSSMHSGKLNWTERSSSVQLSFPLCIGLNTSILTHIHLSECDSLHSVNTYTQCWEISDEKTLLTPRRVRQYSERRR